MRLIQGMESSLQRDEYAFAEIKTRSEKDFAGNGIHSYRHVCFPKNAAAG
jgi:hypothetical protein